MEKIEKKKLRPIMFVGTCSDAGKSILNTAFCRIFRQDGYRPAPFKAQNMSLNSCSTPEGGEIGRAQAVQAEACGILPHTDMNPVLLKPSTDQTSQVILNGKAVGNMSAREYFRSGNKTQLFTEAVKAFHRLEENHNPIVLEGAGSISELNLRDRDITNMRMAKEVDAATYLVADIDRGGVFASVYGSVMLLPEEERCLIKGVIINKFRGDVSLFEEGRVVGKWLARNSRVVIFDEPTRGIDVGAKVEIYQLMNQLKKQGIAVMFVSSEMPEVMGVADRIIVMCDGRITGEVMAKETTQNDILKYATSFENKLGSQSQNNKEE